MTLHSHFEDLIFSGKSLSSKEQSSLIEHLDGCLECTALYRSWQSIHRQIDAAQMKYPSPNFREKWGFDLENRKMLARTMQARKMLLFSFTGTALSLLIAFVFTLVLTTPADLIIGLVKSLNNLVLLINLLRTFSLTIFQIIPPIIPLYYMLVFTSTFCMLTVLWIYSLWQISAQGVYSK